MFSEHPEYLNTVETAKRKDPEERYQQHCQTYDSQVEEWLNSDSIKDFSDL